jgi:hypothetical protein
MVAGMRAALFAVVLGVAGGSAAAQPAPVAAIVSLKSGQFAWYETPALIKASATGERVSILIGLAQQQAYIFRGDTLVGVSSVSTGSRGHETPTGTFEILQKKEFHRSNLYSNAPMPFMQRLTWTGIALHAGPLPGYPASHGCIRLPAAFARDLYALTALGGAVTVVADLRDDPRLRAPLAPAPVAPMIAAETRGLHGRPVAAPQLAAETRRLRGARVELAARGPEQLLPAALRDAVYREPAVPRLPAEMRNLGGGAYDVVTMPGTPPSAEMLPTAWSRGRRGSR